MKLIHVPTDQIKVKENRIRIEFGEVQELADSIKRLGQIQPAVIAEKPTEGGNTVYYELIAGERRLRAAQLAEVDLLCVLKEDVDEEEMLELEIEENLKRKQFTPAEECEAVKRLHEMKVKQHGLPTPGATEKQGWTVEDTAKTLGQSRRNIGQKLEMATYVEKFPVLRKEKKFSDIKKVIKGLHKIAKTKVAVEKFEQQKEAKNAVTWTLSNKDAEVFLEEQKDGSFDLVFTDPPYGIDITNIELGGASKATGFSYEDEKTKVFSTYSKLAYESYRITKDNGHCYVFFAPEFLELVKSVFTQAGWLTNHRPIIWVKNQTGQTTQPTMWPASCYEMLFYFRKEKSRLVVEGQADYVHCPPVERSKKVHPSQKPHKLLAHLISRVTRPGDHMIDPYMGSGSFVVAGVDEKLIVSGNDIAPECCNMAKEALYGRK